MVDGTAALGGYALEFLPKSGFQRNAGAMAGDTDRTLDDGASSGKGGRMEQSSNHERAYFLKLFVL